MTSYAALKSKSKESLDFWLESAKQDFMISVFSGMSRLRLSKAELSERIGCSPSYITKILKGDANFTIETMVKISRALDTKLCIHLSDANESIQWMGVVRSKPLIGHQPNQRWALPASTHQAKKFSVAAHG